MASMKEPDQLTHTILRVNNRKEETYNRMERTEVILDKEDTLGALADDILYGERPAEEDHVLLIEVTEKIIRDVVFSEMPLRM